MRNNIITIARKEFARFFSNKASAAVAILLPGLLIYGMWSILGSALSDIGGDEDGGTTVVAAINLPESVESLATASDLEILSVDDMPSASTIRENIAAGDYQMLAVFPEGFDEDVLAYDSGSGLSAPQIELFYDSTNTESTSAYMMLTSLLDMYESSLSNRFDVNAGDETYDVSDERDRASTFIVSIVPMLLLILLFSGCMSVAAESIAGEKERGTMATMLATPIKRSDIALGKILALSVIGMAIGASSAIGIFASLPNLTQGSIDINVYGASEYALLALVIFSTTLVIVMLIALVSALAKTTKEAQLYLTPLMIVVTLIGLLGMFGEGAKPEMAYYFIPLYNSVQCMIGIFTFDFQPINVVICIVTNLVITGVGVFILQKMFNSERLMFAR